MRLLRVLYASSKCAPPTQTNKLLLSWSKIGGNNCCQYHQQAVINHWNARDAERLHGSHVLRTDMVIESQKISVLEDCYQLSSTTRAHPLLLPPIPTASITTFVDTTTPEKAHITARKPASAKSSFTAMNARRGKENSSSDSSWCSSWSKHQLEKQLWSAVHSRLVLRKDTSGTEKRVCRLGVGYGGDVLPSELPF